MTDDKARTTAAQDIWLLIARLGFASLFIFSGGEKLLFRGDAAAFAAGYGVPFAYAVMPLVSLFEIGCALLIVTGWQARKAAIALAIWMTVLNPWFHPFWKVPPQIWQLIVDSFFHHFVMIGGMIYLAVFGPGRLVPGRLVIAKSRS